MTTLLPSGWAKAPLREFAEVNPGNGAAALSDDALVSFVPMSAVDATTGRLDASIVRPWREVKKGFTRFREGDVVMAKITPSMENGKIAHAVGLTNGFAAGTTELHVIRPTNGVAARYVMYYMLQDSFRHRARARMTGTAGQLRVPASFLEEEELPIAPAAEQARIIEAIDSYLSRLAAAVASLERAQTRLKAYRASVLKAAVEGRLVPTEAALARAENRDYEPADVLLKRIVAERRRRWEESEMARMIAAGKPPKDDKWKLRYREPVFPDTSGLPDLPQGWCWTTLDALGDVKGGVTKGQRRPPGTVVRVVPYLRVANVQRGYLNLKEIKTIAATEEEIIELRLEPGDVLFTEGGDRDKLGRGWVWDGEIELCIHQNHVFRARVPAEAVRPRFLSAYSNGNAQRYFLAAGKQTTNLASLNLTKLRSLPVPLAPTAEQDRILNELDRLLSIEADGFVTCQRELRRCTRLRQAILQWAFAGKLVDPDPSAEPADKLLARIQEERSSEARLLPTRTMARKSRGRKDQRLRTVVAGGPEASRRRAQLRQTWWALQATCRTGKASGVARPEGALRECCLRLPRTLW
ncbi:MAG: hypothetical protein ACR2OG_02800 [Gemmatimonadaceae bacterium]